MKMKIFEAIRNNSLEQVVACVEADPACVNAIAPKKPNDTKGMSPLQAALTTGWHRKIAWYLLEQCAEKSTFSSYARKTSTELYRGEPIWKLVGGLLEEDEGGGAEKSRPEVGTMEQHSEQDLQYAAEFREGVHAEALERIQKLHPEIGEVVDKWPVEAYFQEHWDYPGKWYTVVAIPAECKSRKALVDAIVSDTLKQHGISASDYYVLTDVEYKRYARMALVNGHLTEADYDRFCDGNVQAKAETPPAGDTFYALLAEYPRLDVEYCIVPDSRSSCRGCEAHRLALKQAFRKLSADGGEWSYDVIAARGKQIDAGELFAPAREAEELNYRGAFLHPPHGCRYTDADFDRVNAALFPNGTDGLEVYRWTTDWSDYFDDGHEWWGTLCLSVYDKSTGRFAVLLASATD